MTSRLLPLFLLLWVSLTTTPMATLASPLDHGAGAARLDRGAGAARFRSLVGGQPDVVKAVSALGRARSQRLYASVEGWSEKDPELTGTLRQAGEGLVLVVLQPGWGAETAAAITDRLPPRSAQAFLVGLAGTARGSDPWSMARAEDSVTALLATPEASYVDALVGHSLTDIASLSELNGLRILDLATLPPRKRLAVKRARLSVPEPNPGQRLQKVIKLRDLERFLSGEFSPSVGGSVAFYDQVSFLRTPAELIAGLRLDYPKGFAGETRVGALVFPRPAAMTLRVPFDPLLGGVPSPELVYPFTGTGFTACVRGRLVPELALVSSVRLPLPEGALAFEIDEAGVRHLRGTLGPDGQWITAR